MVDLPGGTDANAPTMIDTPARLGAKYAGTSVWWPAHARQAVFET